MAAIDGIAATLDELDDMEPILSFDDGRDFAGFEGECGGLEFSDHVAASEETEFATLSRGAGVFGIEGGEGGEAVTGENTLAQFVQFELDTFTFIVIDIWFACYFGNFECFGDIGDTVGGDFVEELVDLVRGDLDCAGQTVLHPLGQHTVTEHGGDEVFHLVVGIACSLAYSFAASILAFVGFEIILDIGFNFLVGNLGTVEFTFVDKELVYEQALKDIAAVLECVFVSLPDTNSEISVLNIGEFDDVFADNSDDLVDDSGLGVGTRGRNLCRRSRQKGNE